MALVRAQPFASVKAGTYGWADTEDLRTAMEKDIAGAAAALAGIRRCKGELKGAAEGLAKARLLVGISPGLGEEMLCTAAEESASELGARPPPGLRGPGQGRRRPVRGTAGRPALAPARGWLRCGNPSGPEAEAFGLCCRQD